MKFAPTFRTKKLGMIYTILGSFCSFLNWEGANILPQIRPRKIPDPEDRFSHDEVHLIINQISGCTQAPDMSA